MTTAPQYVVSSEEDFLNFINNIRSNHDLSEDNFAMPEIHFNGWPTLDINVRGEGYSSSVSTAMLFGLTLLTEEIQRAYAVLRYGSANLQRLTNEDKQQLDIIFTISEGSSDAEGDTSGFINRVCDFLTNTMANMSGWQKMAVLLAMVGFAGWCGHEYITSPNANVETITATGNAINQALTTVEEIRREGDSHISREVDSHALAGKTGLLKHLANDSKVHQVKLGNHTYDRTRLNIYNSRQSVERERREVTDDFIIRGVSKSGQANQDISISVMRVRNDQVFTIKTSPEVITENELSQILHSWSTNTPVRIHYLEVTENGSLSMGMFTSIVP